MKNRLIKRSHLSEKQCHEIIQLFTEDLTATQIANITLVSRVTINNYLKLIRTQIARFCEEKNPHYHRHQQMHENTVLKQPKTSINDEAVDAPHPYYGFYKAGGNVYADRLNDIDKHSIHELQRMKLLHDTIAEHQSPLNAYTHYHAIADFNNWRLFRIDTAVNLKSPSPADEVTAFWSNTKNRLLKFRGLNKSTLPLHVKESEFRFNFRNENINDVLMGIINKRPLHFSKAS
jgi:transposase